MAIRTQVRWRIRVWRPRFPVDPQAYLPYLYAPMDIYLAAIGCRLNEAELESWHHQFKRNGHRVVSAPRHAQVIVMNTCAVTSMAARKSRQHVNRLHRQNPNARLVVTGCYAEMDNDKVAELAGVDLVVGNQQKDRLVQVIAESLDVPTMPQIATEPETDGSHVFATARTRAFLKIQDGCRNRCTFCIVTVLRGEERSVTVSDVVSQVNRLHGEGYQEVVLTGVHLGGYGGDIGTDLKALVQAVLNETDIPRIRLTSLEPWDLPEGFFSLWQNSRLQPHLHMPLQSGCDATLKRMSRRCSPSSFRTLVEQAREAIPDLTLTTDLIVGFPGEDEAEWKETLAFVEEMGFAHIHIFTFSARQGTKAARLGNQVPVDIRKARSRALHTLCQHTRNAHLDRFIGQARPVLWEAESVETLTGERRFSGYTDNFLRVSTVVAPEVTLANQILPTQLVERAQGVYVGQVLPH